MKTRHTKQDKKKQRKKKNIACGKQYSPCFLGEKEKKRKKGGETERKRAPRDGPKTKITQELSLEIARQMRPKINQMLIILEKRREKKKRTKMQKKKKT